MTANVYRYPVDKLFTGSSLGNLEMFVKLTPQSDVAGVWSALDNQFYCGRWVTHFYVGGERAAPQETTFAAASQETSFACGPLQLRKRTFVPVRGQHLQIVCQIVEVSNPTDEARDVAVMCDAHYPAFVWPDASKIPELAQRNKRVTSKEQNGLIVSATVGREEEVRVFGGSLTPVSTYVTDRGFSRTFAMHVPPRSSERASLMLAISNNGSQAALATYKKAPPADAMLAETERFYDETLRTGFIRTPDAMINRAIDWAKINTVRVQHRYPAGAGFTNDPSQDIIVMRDAAW